MEHFDEGLFRLFANQQIAKGAIGHVIATLELALNGAWGDLSASEVAVIERKLQICRSQAERLGGVRIGYLARQGGE